MYGKKKKMYRQFARDMNTMTDTENKCMWVRRSWLTIETESLIYAAQEQVLMINYVICRIDNTTDSDRGRVCC